MFVKVKSRKFYLDWFLTGPLMPDMIHSLIWNDFLFLIRDRAAPLNHF